MSWLRAGITVGDQPGNFSGMVPLRFVRALYCADSSFRLYRGAAATERGCPATAAASKTFPAQHPILFHASGFSVHPYPQGQLPPNVPTSIEPDYADLPALPNLERTLDRLQGLYGSSEHFPLYSTEFGYQTNPPEKIARAVSVSTAALYLNWAEYISWRDPRIRSYDQYLLSDPVTANAVGRLRHRARARRRDAQADLRRLPDAAVSAQSPRCQGTGGSRCGAACVRPPTPAATPAPNRPR